MKEVYILYADNDCTVYVLKMMIKGFVRLLLVHTLKS